MEISMSLDFETIKLVLPYLIAIAAGAGWIRISKK